MTALSDIGARIEAALKSANRPANSVKLLAVSKVQPRERVEAVLQQGHRIFGENRVQEAQGRWIPLREAYNDVELHLIGPLQTNKIKPAQTGSRDPGAWRRTRAVGAGEHRRRGAEGRGFTQESR